MNDAEDWGKLSLIVSGQIYDVPGIIERIEGCDRVQVWVVQKGINASFAFTIWRGAQLCESVKLTFRFVDAAERDAYIQMGQNLSPVWGQQKPISSMPVNAAFAAAGVTRVGIRSWGLAPSPAPGLSWTTTMDLIEYRKAVPAPVGPADPPKKESENDKLQKEFDRQLEKAATYGNPFSNPFK